LGEKCERGKRKGGKEERQKLKEKIEIEWIK
jgi:hypothetical protein